MLAKMFEEQQGEVSCMRVMSFLSLLIGASIAYYGIFKGQDLSSYSTTIGIFVGAAFGGKLGQKYFEGKNAN